MRKACAVCWGCVGVGVQRVLSASVMAVEQILGASFRWGRREEVKTTRSKQEAQGETCHLAPSLGRDPVNLWGGARRRVNGVRQTIVPPSPVMMQPCKRRMLSSTDFDVLSNLIHSNPQYQHTHTHTKRKRHAHHHEQHLLPLLPLRLPEPQRASLPVSINKAPNQARTRCCIR